MKKQELITALQSMPFVKVLIGEPVEQSSSDGVKWYGQNYLEVDGNVAHQRKKSFYVVNEGLEAEEAFWEDEEPKQQVKCAATLETEALAAKEIAPSLG